MNDYVNAPGDDAGDRDERAAEEARASVEDAGAVPANPAPAKQEPKEPEIVFEYLSIKSMIQKKPPPLDFVLHGLLAGTIGAFVSPGSAGKTMAIMQTAIGVCGGRDQVGLVVKKPGKVCMYLAEDPSIVLWHRMHDIGARMIDEDSLDAIDERMNVSPLLGKSPDIMNKTWFNSFVRDCRGSDLVVFDTLRRIHHTDENDSSDMAKLVAKLELLAAETGAAVVFLHHASKAAGLNGNVDAQQASRGSSVLVDNVRWQAFMQSMSKEEAEKVGLDDFDRKKYVRLGVSKQNYGPALCDAWLQRGEEGVLAPSPIDWSDPDFVAKVTPIKRGRA
jgi:hypothetical protein